MRTFRGKYDFDQIPLIASHMELLLQNLFTVKEKPILFCTNQIGLSSKLTSQKHKTVLSWAKYLSIFDQKRR